MPPRTLPKKRKTAPVNTVATPNLKHSLWQGPEKDGITFSLLSRFLCCRERFRLRVVEGLVEDEGFNHTIEFGSIWHAGEEAFARKNDWAQAMANYTSVLFQKYPTDEKEIAKWYSIAKAQFPIYIDYWRHHPDQRRRRPVLEEAAFRVPYLLPSGRKVILRGKFDCVLLLGNSLYLQENKTKGTIDEEGIQKTVAQNLQTMLYQIALRQSLQHIATAGQNDWFITNICGSRPHESILCELTPFRSPKRGYKIGGVIYNVVRRPLADRFAIKQRKSETLPQFYKRLASVIKGKPDYFFHRWNVGLQQSDINRFRQRVFDPILEQLCDWWEWVSVDPFDPWTPRMLFRVQGSNEWKLAMVSNTHKTPLPRNQTHFQAPWGVYNSLAGGFRGDYFDLLTSEGRRTSGLRKIDNLYPELTSE